MSKTEQYISYWKEMWNCVEKLINITQPITTGAENKLGTWPMKNQYDHILSEVTEAYAEYYKGNSAEDEIDEDMDILMTALTLFHKKGYSHQDKKFSVARMIQKYEKRGFLKFE